MKDVFIFAIESTCDETSCAVIKNGCEVISLSILSQMDIHAEFGGVVPEIASRLHVENITMVIEDALKKADMKMDEMSAIAVSYAPGLMGSLLVGVECAKTLALAHNKPLITVNHLVGHIYANRLEHEFEYPILALIVSGGHTETILMEDDYKFKLLGKTYDDALGETYDKVARVLDLKYPGGPNVEKYALSGSNVYPLTVPVNNDDYNFSFSGLKSNIINLVHNEKQRGNEINKENLACSFQTTAIKEVTNKVELCLKDNKVTSLIVCGGVSANKYLQQELGKLTDKYNIKLLVPRLLYCTDNAAMIGAAAYPLFMQKKFASYDVSPSSHENIV